MQQIKFRIWDQSKKVMCSVARISFGDDGSALTILAEPAPVGEFYRALVHGESGILMQFTGLKDKKGREIYEDDIIKWHRLYDGESLTDVYRVEWDNGCFHTVCISEAGQGQRDCFSSPETSEELHHFQVIGNIYENPELLEA
jgi:uncharacterized phage protein (TIGR01671 family)